MTEWIAGLPVAARAAVFLAALVVGVFCLVKFCDLFVDAASALARILRVSPLIIGLTVVALGTSCPELAVSVSDSISTLLHGGHANVALGNAVGSNICNLLLVLGCSILVMPVAVKPEICRRDFPILSFVSLLLVGFGCLFGPDGSHAILRWEGAIFCVLMVAYLVFLVRDAKRHPALAPPPEEIKAMKPAKAIVFVLLGALGIAFGGEAVVFGAKGVALLASDAMHVDHDMAESLIGLTIVAVGTSLPELVTSMMAARKGENDLALGNVIGSNIFNALFVLGLSSVVNPLTTGNQIVVDLFVMLAATALVFGLSLRGRLGRAEGALLLLCYLAYLSYLIARTLSAGV